MISNDGESRLDIERDDYCILRHGCMRDIAGRNGLSGYEAFCLSASKRKQNLKLKIRWV
jgi:hypothetical protein